jgi:hypothetical protein
VKQEATSNKPSIGVKLSDPTQGDKKEVINNKQQRKQKFRIQCWTCGEYGHMARDCCSGQSNTQIDQVDESNTLTSWNNWNS